MFTRLFQDIAATKHSSLEEHGAWRLLFDSIIDYGVALVDVNGAFSLWNAAAQRLTGYDPEYVTGRQFADIFPGDPPDSGDRWLSLQETLQTGRSEFEVTYPPGAGPSQRLKLIVTPIHDARGKHHGYIVIMHESATSDSTLTRNTGKLSFELLVNSVEDYAIFMLDPDGRILSWNLGAERLKGYRADEIIGDDISLFYTAADRNSSRPQGNLAIAAQNGRFEGEGWRIRKDGSLFWASVVITALRDKSGRLRGFGKVTRDLTRHYRATIAPMQNGMLLLCPEGTTFACNPSACRLLGLPQERIFGRRFADLNLQVIHEDGSTVSPNKLPSTVTLATGNSCHDVVLGFRIPDGDTNWVSVDTDILDIDKTGHPTGIVVSMHDISKLKRSNDAIRRGEQLFRSLVAASAQIVWEADPDGTFRTISSSFETLTGKSVGDAQGLGWLAALPATDQIRVKKVWQRAHHRGEMFEVECRLQLTDGTTRYYLMRGVPLKTDEGTVQEWVGTLTDIDARKRHEQELVRKAHYDELTGLANRKVLTDRLQQAIAHADRAEQLAAILFLDLDNFKDINDGLGHQHGDRLLQIVAKRLAENVRSGDTVARVGGDEFVILLTQLRDPADVESFHRKLRKVFAEPVVIGERIERVTVSIGVAITPVDGLTVTDLLRHADLAMYRVKQQGRNGLAFYQPDMDIPEVTQQSGNKDGNR